MKLALPFPRRADRPRMRGDRRLEPEEIIGLRSVSEQTIYPHVFGSVDREVGGVLVGRTPKDCGLPLITGAIPAISADEQRATLTFTQDAWAHVHNTLDSSFPPDEQIVGWYHSHPSFGIFLSGHDLFIHENFFNGPSQIAVVVDPIGCREGAFVWQDGELSCLYEVSTPTQWQPPQELLAARGPSSGGRVELAAPVPAAAPAPAGGEARKERLLAIAAIATAAVMLALVLVLLLQQQSGPRRAPRSVSAPSLNTSRRVTTKASRRTPAGAELAPTKSATKATMEELEERAKAQPTNTTAAPSRSASPTTGGAASAPSTGGAIAPSPSEPSG
ncbi:MAG: M67 family metallopeptidase [Solirubrobacteraceae bacterium]